MLDPDTTHQRGAWYDERRWTHAAPILGILAVVLWLVGVFVIEGSAGSPSDDAGPAELAAYFNDNSGAILVGSYIFILGSAVWLPFLVFVRARMDAAASSLGTAVLVTGIGAVLLATASFGPQIGGALEADSSDAGVLEGSAQAFWSVGDGMFVAATAVLAVFFVSAAIAMLRSRTFPAWFAWVTLVFGLVSVIAPIGWLALIFGLPIWTLVVATYMWTGAQTRGGEPAARPAA